MPTLCKARPAGRLTGVYVRRRSRRRLAVSLKIHPRSLRRHATVTMTFVRMGLLFDCLFLAVLESIGGVGEKLRLIGNMNGYLLIILTIMEL